MVNGNEIKSLNASAQARSLVSTMSGMDLSWRNLESIAKMCNAILAAYQIALVKTLGSGAGAMSQILLNELGDVLIQLAGEISGEKREVFEEKDITNIIVGILKTLGIAKDVEVQELESTEKHGQTLRRFSIKIWGSIFTPAHRVLVNRGVKSYSLSPEALLVAAILRKMLRDTAADKSIRVNVTAKLPESEDQPLEIIVEQITSLKP